MKVLHYILLNYHTNAKYKQNKVKNSCNYAAKLHRIIIMLHFTT